jgi:hypothetical protein
MLWTRDVGCMKSNQMDPPWMFLSAGLKPYRAGLDRIRKNVSHAEKSITVASGWLIAKAAKPRRNSSFQFPNRMPLSPILAPRKTQVLFSAGGRSNLLTDRRHGQRWDVNQKKVAGTSPIKGVLRGKKSGDYRGNLGLVVCVPERRRRREQRS